MGIYEFAGCVVSYEPLYGSASAAYGDVSVGYREAA